MKSLNIKHIVRPWLTIFQFHQNWRTCHAEKHTTFEFSLSNVCTLNWSSSIRPIRRVLSSTWNNLTFEQTYTHTYVHTHKHIRHMPTHSYKDIKINRQAKHTKTYTSHTYKQSHISTQTHTHHAEKQTPFE